MTHHSKRAVIQEILDLAGVTINGKNPWDIQITHPHFIFSLLRYKLSTAMRILFNHQSKVKLRIVGKHHYDRGNDLFEKMLDKRLFYS